MGSGNEEEQQKQQQNEKGRGEGDSGIKEDTDRGVRDLGEEEKTRTKMPSSSSSSSALSSSPPSAKREKDGGQLRRQTTALDFLKADEVEEEEKYQVGELESRLSSLLSSLPDNEDVKGSLRLLRFLRGYQHDVVLAEASFREHIQWRKDHGVDELRREIFSNAINQPEDVSHHSHITKYLPMNFMLRDDTGTYVRDKYHHLISLDRYGEWDLNGVISDVPSDMFDKWYIQSLEFRNIVLDRLSREEGRVVKVTMVKDLGGFSVLQLSRQGLSLAQRTVGVARDNYPESIAKILIVNAPWMFAAFWKGISHWLRPRTIAKVSILGGDFEEELFERIAPKNLPSYLGGTSRSKLCDAPGGRGGGEDARLDKGGAGEKGADLDVFRLGKNATIVDVPAGKAYSLSVKIAPGGKAEWSWGVESYDIGFSVRRVNDSPKGAEGKVMPFRQDKDATDKDKQSTLLSAGTRLSREVLDGSGEEAKKTSSSQPSSSSSPSASPPRSSHQHRPASPSAASTQRGTQSTAPSSPEDPQSDEDVVISYSRTAATKAMKGEFTLRENEAPCSLIFEWDNTYSFLRSKVLHCKVRVFDVKEQKAQEEAALRNLTEATKTMHIQGADVATTKTP